MYNYKNRPLINYIPTVLKEVTQYKALTFGEQPEIFNLFEEIKTALNNQFILTATKYGIERWEQILSIVPKATQTLEERKFGVLTKLAEGLPYTMRMLEEMLSVLCGENGYDIVLMANDYVLTVRIDLTVKSAFDDVIALLKRVVPANMIVNVYIKYNSNEYLSQFTHQYLSQFTHAQLREDVL